VTGLELVVDLVGRLGDQEQAATEQDQVAPREASTENREQRLGEPHHPGQREEEPEPHDERERDAEAAGLRLVLGGQLGGEDRDEDDVVDAEHDLHRGECQQADVRVGVGQELEGHGRHVPCAGRPSI
jgi:hypothetical protein